MVVNKNARTRSVDPLQERLRQRKQEWNVSCSEFIARLNAFKPHLIAFKRGLNGRGDAKAGLPISDIKNPLPEQIGGYLGVVSSEFNDLAATFSQLVGEAGSVMQEQSQYAQQRRKSHRQASRIDVPDDLIVEGSSALTRFWANLSSTLSSNPMKAQRLSMLHMAHSLFKSFVDFEDATLNKGVENVPEILNNYFLVSNKVNGISLALQRLVELKNQQKNVLEHSTPKHIQESPSDNNSKQEPIITDKPQPNESAIPSNLNAPEDLDEDSPIEKLKDGVVFMMNLGFTIENIRPFLDLFHKHRKETSEDRKELMEDQMREVYANLFEKLKSRFEDKLKRKLPPDTTLGDLLDLFYKKACTQEELAKYSANYFTRLIKKYRHQFGIKDASSAARMEIYHLIREAKIHSDKLMDLLESKYLDLDSAAEKMSKIEELIIKMSEPLKLLNVLYKDRYYEKDMKKQKDPTMNPAGRYFTKQVRKDVDKPGW
jgi:DNA-binding transcriptional MerR regulator